MLYTLFLWMYISFSLNDHPRANGAERRSGRKPGARVLIFPTISTRGNES
jgi:hypothetical protein